MTISLTSAEIQEWARRINETIRSLTDIDAILDATRDNLNMAQELKRRADEAKYGKLNAMIITSFFLFLYLHVF